MKHFLSFFGKSRLLYVVFSFALAFTSLDVFAQDKEFEVSGRILDATTNEPLAGCNISVKGTITGASSGIDGRYSIKVPNENAILVFQFIGYEKQELLVGAQKEINISLKESALQLSNIVVIGYGTTQEKDLTGAATSVKASEFNRGIINSPEQLLQGKVSGVNITSASGEPGSPQGITIRGPGGVRTGNTPLYVIDGLPLDNSSTGGATNPLNFLNPQDIESIDVLKDASATAIYGTRGANGVIIITTKKGKSGFSSINYSSNMGISTLARPLDVFTADEFRTQVVATGGVLVDEGANTDWQKEISRTAYTFNNNLSLSGGSNNLSYYASFGIQKQQGIIKNSQLDTYSGRINLTQRFFNDRVSVDINLTATNTVNLRPPFNGLIANAITANPTYPAYNSDGTPFAYQGGVNPLLTLALEKDKASINRLVGTISPSVTIIKGLVYKLNFGVDNSTGTRDFQSLASSIPQQEGRLQTNDTYNRNSLIENYLTYTFDISKHSFAALVGHSYQKFFLQGRSYSINRFTEGGIEPIYNPGVGQDLTLLNNRPFGYATENELQSFFSRVNYQFNNKYLLTATVRVDGSTKFGNNNKYGVFPSVSAAWRISEEAFLQNSFVSDLKLRAGWGLTGNQEIPSKITQPLFTVNTSATNSYPLDNSNNYPEGLVYTRLANDDIQWEVSEQFNFGLDFAFFKGALSGTIDYFGKQTSNVLLEVIPADPIQPSSSVWTNVENMTITNKGLEIALNYRYVNDNSFMYEIGGNLTLIDNVIKNSPYSVIPSGSASGSGLTSATINGYINNQSIGTFFLQEFLGINENGLSQYRDLNNDGVITSADRIVAGSALPTTLYNFNLGVGYKGFELRANFNGVSGNKIYDNTANANFYKTRISRGLNTTAEAIQFPNESTDNSAPVSTRYLKDAAFLRLNNLSLTYNLQPRLIKLDKWVKAIQFSVTGQNLFIITDYDGYDPEVNTDRTINGVLSYGIDYLSYPRARSVIFGLNVSF